MIRIIYNIQTLRAIQYLTNVTEADKSFFSDTLYGKLEGAESTVESQAQAIGVTNVDFTLNTLINPTMSDYERTDSDQAFGMGILREFNAGKKQDIDTNNVYEGKMEAFSLLRRSLWEGHIKQSRDLLFNTPLTITVDGLPVVLLDSVTKQYFLDKMDNYLSQFS